MTSYNVKYMYISYADVPYRDDVDFDSLENAKAFIERVKNDVNVEKICYIYLTTIEKVI